jgi:hypothetical protein
MLDKSGRNGSIPSRRTLTDAAALANAIKSERAHLTQAQAVVRSVTQLLHESYSYEIGEADLGYCGDVIGDMIQSANTTLQSLILASDVARQLRNPRALAVTIESSRQTLFRAQAVARAVATIIRGHKFGPLEADLRDVLTSIDDTIERVISGIEPLHLGLPIPTT